MNDTSTGTPPENPLDQLSAEELRQMLPAERQQFDEYRTLVRDRAIEGFRDHEWTLAQLNTSLQRLGLPAYEPNHMCRCSAAIEYVLEIGDSDSEAASAQIAELDSPGLREDINEAVIAVLRRRCPERVTVSSPSYFSVHFGQLEPR